MIALATLTGSLPRNMMLNKVARSGDPHYGGGFADVYIGWVQRSGTLIKVAIKALRCFAAGDARKTDDV